MAFSWDASVVRAWELPFALRAFPLAVPFKDFTTAPADPFVATALPFTAAATARLAFGLDLTAAAAFASEMAVWYDAMKSRTRG